MDHRDIRRSPCRGRDFPLKSANMAVPPIQRSRAAATAPGPSASLEFPWLLDVVLGLLIVGRAATGDRRDPQHRLRGRRAAAARRLDRPTLIRAHGLALPAMILTVPLAAVGAARRQSGPACWSAGSPCSPWPTPRAGTPARRSWSAVLRVLHGVGAGLLMSRDAGRRLGASQAPARRVGGHAGVSLLTAQALALWPLDEVDAWRVTLQPYPLLTGIALGAGRRLLRALA